MSNSILIVPFGCSCVTAIALNRIGLRKQSLPFDWLAALPLSQTIDLLENHFDNFLDLENLERFRRDSGKHAGYINKSNNIMFLHDFPKDGNYMEDFPAVREKYNRRISRLYQLIACSQQILFIHCSEEVKLHTVYDNRYIIEQFDRLKQMYPQKDIFLCFCNLIQEIRDKDIIEKNQINENIVRYDCYKPKPKNENYLKGKPDLHHYVPALEKIFSQYGVRWWNVWERALLKFLISLVPFKENRRRLRQKYRLKRNFQSW